MSSLVEDTKLLNWWRKVASMLCDNFQEGKVSGLGSELAAIFVPLIKENKKLQAQPERAEGVIGFYAEGQDDNFQDKDSQPNIIPKDWKGVSWANSKWVGGKLAREYQAEKERG